MGKTTYYPKAARFDKLTKGDYLELGFDLLNAFRLVRSPSETALFIHDLLTESEIKQLAKRLRIAKLLLAGNKQRDISKNLHCSLATVTKVSTWLGSGGVGLRWVIQRLPKRYNIPKINPKGALSYRWPQTLLALAQLSAAKGQTKRLEKFWGNVEDKKQTDRQLREIFNELYSARSFEKRKTNIK